MIEEPALCTMHFLVENSRVILREEQPDYIHAVAANVSVTLHFINSSKCVHNIN